MPTDPRILGFANRWFPEAFETAQPHRLANGLTIRIVTAPLLLATKLEAFSSRGNHDYAASKDMEDIVAVIHGREEVVDEANEASADVRRYLAEQAAALLANPAFAEALAGHLPGEDITRVPRRLAGLAERA
jgi:predicted nucleotidyltransferase